jgi:hypothetical protein
MAAERRQGKCRASEAPMGKLVGYGRVSIEEQNVDLQLHALREAGCREE